jgi:DNA-binding response OmpR family regulator
LRLESIVADARHTMFTEPRPHILIVEDDADLADLLALYLAELSCGVEAARTGPGALACIDSGRYDAIVLDVGLPVLDGLSVCRQLRQRRVYTPVLMLTARCSEADRVAGLEIGADDYLTKPFNPGEFQARVKALLRRAGAYNSAIPDGAVVTSGDLTISAGQRVVTRAGATVELTAREFDLLLWMARHPGRVFTREQLLDAVWGYTHAGYGHTVDSHVNRLRAKLERDPRDPQFVVTVRSVGYKFIDSL